jgi:hypothetical protein
MEARVEILSEGLRLEAAFEPGEAGRGVVISHPHPLYGGDMDNPVVIAVRRACRRRGYATLRFNFRGVGASAGRYDEGRGERQDVRAALAFAAARTGADPDLAGYSFGAWVNAGIASGCRHQVMVSPPVAFMDFGRPAPIAALALIATGSLDPIAPAERIAALLPAWNPQAALAIIDGADHFYSGRLARLEDAIAERLPPP